MTGAPLIGGGLPGDNLMSEPECLQLTGWCAVCAANRAHDGLRDRLERPRAGSREIRAISGPVIAASRAFRPGLACESSRCAVCAANRAMWQALPPGCSRRGSPDSNVARAATTRTPPCGNHAYAARAAITPSPRGLQSRVGRTGGHHANAACVATERSRTGAAHELVADRDRFAEATPASRGGRLTGRSPSATRGTGTAPAPPRRGRWCPARWQFHRRCEHPPRMSSAGPPPQ